jgi:hypothetical protein
LLSRSVLNLCHLARRRGPPGEPPLALLRDALQGRLAARAGSRLVQKRHLREQVGGVVPILRRQVIVERPPATVNERGGILRENVLLSLRR